MLSSDGHPLLNHFISDKIVVKHHFKSPEVICCLKMFLFIYFLQSGQHLCLCVCVHIHIRDLSVLEKEVFA